MFVVLSPEAEGFRLIYIRDKNLGVSESFIVSNRTHASILNELINFCLNKNINIGRLNGIGVVQSTGTFTGIRQCVSVVNAIHWLCGVRTFFLSEIPSDWQSLSLTPVNSFLKPKYNSEPNISKPKK